VTPFRARFLNTLSGRLLLLTAGFVMLAEVLIFVPSIARFRADFLTLRLEKAQIASLAQLAALDMVTPEMEAELLANAEVYNVVLRRDEMRQLVLSSELPSAISQTFDLRLAGPWELIRDALYCLVDPSDQIIRVIGQPVQKAGLLIEITIDQQPLRQAMIDYGLRILMLSALISFVTASLLFLAAQRLIVAPIMRVSRHMKAYADAPEDGRLVIAPTSRVAELRAAEEAMESMQRQLTGSLRQKQRLAQLGGAVAKISHDLRNILTTAQLFADRMENSVDPVVAKASPKLVGSITRAISLCESTLKFGKAEEAAPILRPVPLRALMQDVLEAEGLSPALQGPETQGPAMQNIECLVDVPEGFLVLADVDQLYRVLSNLIRNAKQAIEATTKQGTLELSARISTNQWHIRVGDSGPGLPERAKEHLFEAFQGGARKGGTGLGLAISAELVRGHGGALELLRSDPQGTEFLIRLPVHSDLMEDA
jgi:signal transduction histidine kinase